MAEHRARKRFGQNFLQDLSIITRMVSLIQPKPTDLCVEIGPGLGALTLPLLKACGHLTVIELDRDIIPKLRAKVAGLGELTVFEQDVLTFDFQPLVKSGQKIRLVGNLPYNISSPLLFHAFSQLDCIEDMHFMLQKEVVDRMAAAPGSKVYGRLSVMVQYYCEVASLFDVQPEAFSPAPKVTSSVVRLRPHAVPMKAKDEVFFGVLVREAFNQRRKTITNALKAYCTAEDFLALGLDPKARAEDLSLSDFIHLANALTSTILPSFSKRGDAP